MKNSMTFRPLIWAMLLATMPFNTFGLDLLSAYQMALKSDPTLRGASHDARAVAQQKRQAIAAYLPNLSLQAEKTYTRQNVRRTDNLVFSQGSARFPGQNVNIVLNQPILRFDLLAEIEKSKALVNAAEADYELQRQGLMLRTSNRYFAVLRAKDDLDAIDAEKRAIDLQARLIETQHRSGLARITDLRDVQARRAAVLASQVEARQRLDDARQALAEIIDDLPNNLRTLGDKMTLERPIPADPGAWLTLSLQRNPQIIAQRYRRDSARKEIESKRAGHLPGLDFSATYNRNESSGSLFGGGSNVDTMVYTVRLNVPIYSGGRVTAEVREAAERLGRASDDLDAATRSVRRQVLNGYQRLLTDIVRVKALDEAYQSQQLVLDGKREGYKSGLYTVAAVLDAERDLSRSRRDFARARYDHIVNILRLKQAAGTVSQKDLAQINGWLE